MRASPGAPAFSGRSRRFRVFFVLPFALVVVVGLLWLNGVPLRIPVKRQTLAFRMSAEGRPPIPVDVMTRLEPRDRIEGVSYAMGLIGGGTTLPIRERWTASLGPVAVGRPMASRYWFFTIWELEELTLKPGAPWDLDEIRIRFLEKPRSREELFGIQSLTSSAGVIRLWAHIDDKVGRIIQLEALREGLTSVQLRFDFTPALVVRLIGFEGETMKTYYWRAGRHVGTGAAIADRDGEYVLELPVGATVPVPMVISGFGSQVDGTITVSALFCDEGSFKDFLALDVPTCPSFDAISPRAARVALPRLIDRDRQARLQAACHGDAIRVVSTHADHLEIVATSAGSSYLFVGAMRDGYTHLGVDVIKIRAR